MMQEFQKMLYPIVFMYRLYDIIIICYTDHMTSCGTIYCTGHMTLSHHVKYHTVAIYYKPFNFKFFVILQKLKLSYILDPYIFQAKYCHDIEYETGLP